MLTLKLLTLETVTAAWGVLSRAEAQEHAPGAESSLGPTAVRCRLAPGRKPGGY